MTQLRNRWKPAVALAGILAALLWAGCDDGEEIEPGVGEALSIALSPVVICGGGTSQVQVTMFDQSGDPIVGEEITLAVTPTTGSLSACTDPTPCITDSAGQVTSTFSSATPDIYTLVATGGTVTSAARLSVLATGAGSLTLVPAETNITACSITSIDTIPLSGVRLDGAGAPIQGAIVSLEVVGSTGGLSVTFTSGSVPVVTDSSGAWSASLLPVLSTCTPCAGSPPDCDVTIRVVSDCIASTLPDLTLTESF